MRRLSVLATLLVLLVSCESRVADQDSEAVSIGKAGSLASRNIIVDTHIDLPYRLHENFEDISHRTERGQFDFVRAKKGGLDVAFMAIYVPASVEEGEDARRFADELIDMVEEFASDWPGKFGLARSVEDVRNNFDKGLISLPMGMENGSAIGFDLANLQYFYDRGIRYITLTHAENNQISDSSYAAGREWNGLSPFGQRVVEEMNRLGIMIDVSHISDEAFFQVLELSEAPVIASHSSCRTFTPGWERNMSDDMISALAEKDGVIQINFGSMFLNDDYRMTSNTLWERLRSENLSVESSEGRELIRAFRKENPLPEVTVSDVVAHINHVVDIAGVDHVGLGSDYDGVGGHLPSGLEDVSTYPNLIQALLAEAYSEEEIRKICGENLLRVWGQVSAYSETRKLAKLALER